MHFQDYTYKKGYPEGLLPCAAQAGISYKITSDPYHKWMCIERFKQGLFEATVYDSRLLNFAKILDEEPGYERVLEAETADQCTHLVLSEDDRILYREVSAFQDGVCKQTQIFSCHGLLLARMELHYEGAFTGSRLFDACDHMVLEKRYAIDSQCFTELEATSY